MLPFACEGLYIVFVQAEQEDWRQPMALAAHLKGFGLWIYLLAFQKTHYFVDLYERHMDYKLRLKCMRIVNILKEISQ